MFLKKLNTTSNCLFVFNFSIAVEDFLVKLQSQPQLPSQLSCMANFHSSSCQFKLFPSNRNRIRAPSCFHMIDERLKGLLRLKAHLAPCWGPISCPCASSRTATMQMRRSLQRMTIKWNGCEKVLRDMATGTSRQSFLIGLFSFLWRTSVSNAHGGEGKIRLWKRKEKCEEKKERNVEFMW